MIYGFRIIHKITKNNEPASSFLGTLAEIVRLVGVVEFDEFIRRTLGTSQGEPIENAYNLYIN